ncbi:MAG TPA: hypothetical protein VLT36_26240 [Candidatus Dormibacteraeota bacterium]|nr:hypothetical protein [Candidatus Dormibacteraeota bacterium]
MNHAADKLMTDGRARIIWGDSPQSVREFLVSNGVSVYAAETKVREFELERNRELRRIGLRNILIGGVPAAAASIALYLSAPVASATSGTVRALAVVLLAGLYGCWKLIKGIVYLVRPQSEHKSIPDIQQADLIE